MEEVLEDKELETALQRLKEREGSAKGSTDGVEEQEAPIKVIAFAMTHVRFEMTLEAPRKKKKKHGKAQEEAADRSRTGYEGGWFARESRGQTLRRMLVLKNALC
eukprot:2504178-Amphidinium_carterae.1